MPNMRFKNRPSESSVRICLEVLNTFENSSSESMPNSSSSGLTAVSKRGSFRWHEQSNITRFQKTSQQKSGWKAPWTFCSATGISSMQVHQGKSNTCQTFSCHKRKKRYFHWTSFIFAKQKIISRLTYLEVAVIDDSVYYDFSVGYIIITILCWIHFTSLDHREVWFLQTERC